MIPNSDILDGVDMDEFHQVYLEGNKFASGTIVDYEDSLLVSKTGALPVDSNDCTMDQKLPKSLLEEG